ncbi:hypothetical protein GCK32_010280 [Trichostrongylus colubriformis]|uniref:Uncharacterized protein n=1 Tax=Trichostrongylus colubriformis TaxID=6319 RepID=A0AAN8FBP1_TRICO
MLKRIVLALLAVALAELFTDARFLDEPYYLSSRADVDRPFSLMPFTVQRRTIKRDIENQPIPCRFKLCVSYY